MIQHDLFAKKPQTILELAAANSDKLSAEFIKWLPDNLSIWNAFVAETFKIIRRGHKHYSSRTILEFLRHHSAVSETNSEFKINNNVQPYISRLFDIAHPEWAGLFEYRVTTKKKGNEE